MKERRFSLGDGLVFAQHSDDLLLAGRRAYGCARWSGSQTSESCRRS
jgi:hypothetical protein